MIDRCRWRQRQSESRSSDRQRGLDRPGTVPLTPADRAFWIGLVVVVLSLVSALATLSHPDRPDADRAAQRGRAGRAADQRRADRRHDRGDRLAGASACGRPGEPKCRARGCISASSALFSDHRGAAGDPARRRRDHDVLALARQLVLERARAPSSRTRCDVAQGLSRRARPDHPHRRRQHGPRSRRRGRRRRRATPDALQTVADRASRPARSAGGLHHRRRRACRSSWRSTIAKLPYVVPAARLRLQQAGSGQVPLLDAERQLPRVAARPSSQRIPATISMSRAASARRSSAICSAPSRTSTNTTGCASARGGLKIAHGLIYFMISMTALLAAIWVGMWFAGRFVAPIRRLIARRPGSLARQSRCRAAREARRGRSCGACRDLQPMTRELKSQRTRSSPPTPS